ncbi:hypothetical protein [Leptolyngbya sp. GGD]|uniref:hypothetical protein n=1 Tax=Leptolyngbya sp. GGD TaxID=2997907 RepID=UPI00227A119E|nr:hypothetical protein [Leptolyngbya sp. GGD]MCY6490890.1 hypothetical protein [Leptolyngbya sp. GGD]
MVFKVFAPVLLAGLVAGAVLPATAQVLPKPMTCEATILLDQGSSLIYRLNGIVPNPTSDRPQNPIGTSINMTVQRRDRAGNLQTLLNRVRVNNLEDIAPDADYSKLPFTGVFRGQSNNGFRLYSVSSSTHGLYASLRPTRGQPQQMQIVHYLSRGNFVRSTAGTCR